MKDWICRVVSDKKEKTIPPPYPIIFFLLFYLLRKFLQISNLSLQFVPYCDINFGHTIKYIQSNLC